MKKPSLMINAVTLLVVSAALSACSQGSNSNGNNNNPNYNNGYNRQLGPYQQNMMNNPQNQQANAQWQIAQAQAQATAAQERARIDEEKLKRKNRLNDESDASGGGSSKDSTITTTTERATVYYVNNGGGSGSVPYNSNRPGSVSQPIAQQYSQPQQQVITAPMITRPGAVAAGIGMNLNQPTQNTPSNVTPIISAQTTAQIAQSAPVARVAPAAQQQQSAPLATAGTLSAGVNSILGITYVSQNEISDLRVQGAIIDIYKKSQLSEKSKSALPISDSAYEVRLHHATELQLKKGSYIERSPYIPMSIATAIHPLKTAQNPDPTGICEVNTIGVCLVLERDSRIDNKTVNRAYFVGTYKPTGPNPNNELRLVRSEVPKEMQKDIDLILAGRPDGIIVFTRADMTPPPPAAAPTAEQQALDADAATTSAQPQQ